MRIPTLLQKISELTTQPERRTAIDVDLMMDYTRVLYADLLEWRSRLPATVSVPPSTQRATEPTLAEVANAFEQNGRIQQEVTQPQNQKGLNSGGDTSVAMPVSSSRDIRGLIGINDKYQIMSELFGNDKPAYEQALDFINQSKNENTALHWLREQLWITEERSDAAQSFFEIVSRFFRD